MGRVHTHYDNLKVARTASADEIRLAYRRLAQQHHPDKNRDSLKRAELVMRVINKAYEVLSDPSNRRVHDAWIERSERLQKRSSQREAPKRKAPQQGAPKREAPKQEPPKQESPKQEPPKQEPPKQEPPKQERPHDTSTSRSKDVKRAVTLTLLQDRSAYAMRCLGCFVLAGCAAWAANLIAIEAQELRFFAPLLWFICSIFLLRGFKRLVNTLGESPGMLITEAGICLVSPQSIFVRWQEIAEFEFFCKWERKYLVIRLNDSTEILSRLSPWDLWMLGIKGRWLGCEYSLVLPQASVDEPIAELKVLLDELLLKARR